MDKWKHAVQVGNRYFQEQRFDEALTHYGIGKRRVTLLVSVWFEPAEAIAAFVVVHQNIADVRVAQGNTDEAESELYCCYELLARRLSDCSVADNQEALRTGLRRIYSALMNHHRLYGSVLGKPVYPHRRRSAKPRSPHIGNHQHVSIQ